MINLDLNWHWVRDRFLFILPILCLAFYLVVWVHWVVTSSSYYNPHAGRPLGGDFSYCWSAALLALSGEPEAVYDFSRLAAMELAHFQVKALLPWLYPPTYLLLVLPFGLLPYHAALAVWLSTSLTGYLFIIRRIAPHPRVLWFTLAFPAIFMNLFYGQNGFLSGIFLGGGLLLLDRSPWGAGLLLALLTYKPHLAVLVPVALVAGRRWRALLAMLAWTAALFLATALALGTQVWIAFFNHIYTAMKTLEAGGLKIFWIMSSAFAAVLLGGGGVVSARILQGAAMLIAAAFVVWVWRREAAPPIRNAALVLGILLFIPYGYVYDLTLLALPMAWLGWEGFTRGWLPGEKTCLLLGWLAPLVLPLLAMTTHVQIFPLVLMALMFLVLRRTVRESPSLTAHLEMTGQNSGNSEKEASPFPSL
ncbi:MAG: DUF2029 domain-containing protein [Deltaproteobacteria bacterium]|nr:DUF2029 domain-containing protein [Deltaproteobacteria bacterium]